MNNKININEFYAGLDKMFQRNDKTATMEYMETWLAQANAYNDMQGIVAVSNELGGLCRVLGQHNRAKTLYETVLSNLEAMDMKNTEHYATAMLNYGDVYLFAGQQKQALEHFLIARDLLTRLGLAGDYRMAALCNNISMIYRETGEFDKAEEALSIAFNIIKGMPQCRGELATTYVNLGELQYRQDKIELALNSYEEACRIYEEGGGVDVHYSIACAGMAQIYCSKGNVQRGIELYEKALALIERDFGKTETYRNIERALERVKD